LHVAVIGYTRNMCRSKRLRYRRKELLCANRGMQTSNFLAPGKSQAIGLPTWNRHDSSWMSTVTRNTNLHSCHGGTARGIESNTGTKIRTRTHAHLPNPYLSPQCQQQQAYCGLRPAPSQIHASTFSLLSSQVAVEFYLLVEE
jgi:hypothetical protein